MATQIIGSDHAVLLSYEADARKSAECEAYEPEGNHVRGLFYAMVFNVMLLVTAAAGWELWRLMR